MYLPAYVRGFGHPVYITVGADLSSSEDDFNGVEAFDGGRLDQHDQLDPSESKTIIGSELLGHLFSLSYHTSCQ
jgi:hypothetical protein